MIDHDGSGLSLTGGGKKVELTDFEVDPGKSVLTGKVTVDGKVAAESAPLFFLDGRTLKPLETGDNGTACSRARPSSSSRRPPTCSTRPSASTPSQAGLVIGVAKITVNTA